MLQPLALGPEGVEALVAPYEIIQDTIARHDEKLDDIVGKLNYIMKVFLGLQGYPEEETPVEEEEETHDEKEEETPVEEEETPAKEEETPAEEEETPTEEEEEPHKEEETLAEEEKTPVKEEETPAEKEEPSIKVLITAEYIDELFARKYEKELRAVKEDLRAVKEELGAVKEELHAVKKENTKLREGMDSLNKAQEENYKVQEENHKAQEKINKIQGIRNNDLAAELVALEFETVKLRAQIHDLENQDATEKASTASNDENEPEEQQNHAAEQQAPEPSTPKATVVPVEPSQASAPNQTPKPDLTKPIKVGMVPAHVHKIKVPPPPKVPEYNIPSWVPNVRLPPPNQSVLNRFKLSNVPKLVPSGFTVATDAWLLTCEGFNSLLASTKDTRIGMCHYDPCTNPNCTHYHLGSRKINTSPCIHYFNGKCDFGSRCTRCHDEDRYGDLPPPPHINGCETTWHYDQRIKKMSCFIRKKPTP